MRVAIVAVGFTIATANRDILVRTIKALDRAGPGKVGCSTLSGNCEQAKEFFFTARSSSATTMLAKFGGGGSALALVGHRDAFHCGVASIAVSLVVTTTNGLVFVLAGVGFLGAGTCGIRSATLGGDRVIAKKTLFTSRTGKTSTSFTHTRILCALTLIGHRDPGTSSVARIAVVFSIATADRLEKSITPVGSNSTSAHRIRSTALRLF